MEEITISMAMAMAMAMAISRATVIITRYNIEIVIEFVIEISSPHSFRIRAA
jgi:hypothetical protein